MNEVAETIYEQIGGHRFKVMTGASNFHAFSDALAFNLPSRPGYVKDGINFVLIKLDTGRDTYNIEFQKFVVRNGQIIGKQIAYLTDIYNDQLAEVFERQTGLYTKL
jgi:hypothetical protein